ncbi:hypothetical protein QQ045_013965 [Rhodiola kirilowii]
MSMRITSVEEERGRLSSVLKLFNYVKAKNGWNDRSFIELLQLGEEMLRDGNTLPSRTYDAKKVRCPKGITYNKIHTYPNNYILYQNDHIDLVECLVCKTSCYKFNKEPKTNSKDSPAKVMWYLPIIPRIQRLYFDSEESKHEVAR